MVQMMCSRSKVKLEIVDSNDFHLPKRSKLEDSSSLQQGEVESWQLSILDEPSPLGLRLKKSPSFLDFIQKKLSTQQTPASRLNPLKKKDDKLKASNFPASLLKIGTWEYKSRYEGDLVAKCYFAKHKLVWEMLDGGLKNKIEIQWSDIVAIKASYPDDEPGTLDVVLARQPLFFRETNPQPRKHTLWKATSDFTGGQASIRRQHFLQCSAGLLGKHFEKLIQCDPRLNFLSQQPEILLESLYFESRVSVFSNLSDPSHASELEIAIPAAVTAPQTSSSTANVCQAILSPSSVMDASATEDLSIEIKEPEQPQTKVPGIHSTMSMSDLMSHIGNCISEQMASGDPMFSVESLQGRDILGEIAHYLFSDSQLVSDSDEQIMSRVNSFCCLLQKESVIGQSSEAKVNNSVDRHRENRGADVFTEPNHEADEASGTKQLASMSRKDSVGDLLLNLPRIASLPQLLFSISEDSDCQARH